MKYVTPQEIQEFIATISTVGNSLTPAPIMTIVNGIERAIDRHIGGSAIFEEVDDELYRIDQRDFSKTYAGLITVPRYTIFLKRFPVTQLNSIKQVTAWDATTGEPSQTSTIPRNFFVLDQKRFVIFNAPFGVPIETPLEQVGALVPLLTPFQNTGISLLISYINGVMTQAEFASEYADVKLAVLIEVQRYLKMQKMEAFDTTQIDSEFGHKTVTRTFFTPETIGFLRPLRARVMG